MDSNVIEFPTRTVRNSGQFERTFRRILKQSGASQEMTDEVCRRMVEHMKKFDIQISLPFRTPTALPEWARKAIDDSYQALTKSIAEQIHAYTSDLIHDRLLLEIELYKLRHEGEEPEKP